MISGSRLAGRMLAATALALAPLLAGCQAGSEAPTLHWHPPAPGASAQAGNITISDAFVLGAADGKSIPASGSAGLFLAMVNLGGTPDTLIGIGAPGTATSVSLPGGSIRIGGQREALLTGPQPAVILEHLTRALAGGTDIKITLIFQNAGSIPLTVPVMPRSQYYSTLSPAPRPSPSATPASGNGGSSTASPSPGATKTPRGSQSPTPSASG